MQKRLLSCAYLLLLISSSPVCRHRKNTIDSKESLIQINNLLVKVDCYSIYVIFIMYIITIMIKFNFILVKYYV